jgi:predicted metalloprotease with PDZ domain
LIDVPFEKDRSGIGAVLLPTGFQLVNVAVGSPAERAGLRAGDLVVAIDGESVDFSYVRIHARLGTRPAGTVFRLALQDGRVVTLVLADYY